MKKTDYDMVYLKARIAETLASLPVYDEARLAKLLDEAKMEMNWRPLKVLKAGPRQQKQWITDYGMDSDFVRGREFGLLPPLKTLTPVICPCCGEIGG